MARVLYAPRVKPALAIHSFLRLLNVRMQSHGLGGMIVSDGGCTMPGDVAKAFGGGADFGYARRCVGRSPEAAGKIVERNGENSCRSDMSSESAMTRHVGGVAQYRAAEGKPSSCHCAAS